MIRSKWMICAVVALFAGGCGNNDEDQHDSSVPTDATSQQDGMVQQDGTVQQDAGTPPQLDNGHTGWQNANCGSCHPGAQAVPHPSPYDWWTCAACHGTNGAPNPPGWHNATLVCQDCHPGSAPWNAVSHTDYTSFTGDQCFGCHSP